MRLPSLEQPAKSFQRSLTCHVALVCTHIVCSHVKNMNHLVHSSHMPHSLRFYAEQVILLPASFVERADRKSRKSIAKIIDKNETQTGFSTDPLLWHSHPASLYSPWSFFLFLPLSNERIYSRVESWTRNRNLSEGRNLFRFFPRCSSFFFFVWLENEHEDILLKCKTFSMAKGEKTLELSIRYR